MQIPVVGYVVTNVQRPMSAPTEVDACLSGNGYQVTVNWRPSSGSTDTLLGYHVYRSYDNSDPVQVNEALLSPNAVSFVDSSTLKPGKIYTYYVVARYANGSTEYSTMNPKSSSVVWGIPQLPEDTVGNTQNGTDKHAASILSTGSFGMIIAILALGVSAASFAVTISSKSKKPFEDSEDEE
jgi:hypothetical protein